MKRIIYKIIISCILIQLVSCVGKHDHSHDNESDQETNHQNETHNSHKEEVKLSEAQFNTLKMKIDTLASRNISDYVAANGTLEVPPQNEAAITSVIGATVTTIKVTEGDKVKKGQVVAYLSHPDIVKLQADYLNAYSNRNYLKNDFERQKRLYEGGVGSGANYQKAKAKYEASKANVNGLAAQLRILNINLKPVQNGKISQSVPLVSPIEGAVQKVKVKTGQYVAPQTELLEVVNTHHVHADVMVFEKDVYKIKKGQKVSFKVQSIPDAELMAEIYAVGKTFEENPKAVHVHAEIENKKGNLIPGMYIQGKIQVGNSFQKALPLKAVMKEGDNYYAFTAKKIQESWLFTPVKVVLGEKDGDWVAVEFLEELTSNTKFAFNNAYYLIAEMKKSETEHVH
ncbi:efflux RND transporter periplasmic adaptor subunit [Tenacibaculum amylolyticum]|uniref:efflux RND transporter periplasmic adaptor subunit n=1 Tax=Tenacibaculum amylolyticum TaxID=104269 RepID=UPI003895533D